MRIWLIRFGILVCALLVGAIQENWKIDINYVLDLQVHVPNYNELPAHERLSALKACHPYMPYDYYFSHTNNEWIISMNVPTLQRLKWALTIAFVIVFFGFNYALIRTFETSVNWLRIMRWAYPLAFVLAFAIFVLGKWTHTEQVTYAIAREITGALQSLIPSMCIVPMIVFQTHFETK